MSQLMPATSAAPRWERPLSDTAKKILDAADEVLAESGYEGASIRAVAERAGVGKALVFYHFDSKAALFDRVLERYYEVHLRTLEEAFRGQGTVRARWHRVVDAYFDFMRDHSRYPRLVQQLLAGHAEKTELIRRNLAPLFAWTEQALAELTPAEGPLAARQFFTTFSTVVTGYFTYAPALEPLWEGDPLGAEALEDRRQHLHWLLDRMLDGLESRSEGAR